MKLDRNDVRPRVRRLRQAVGAASAWPLVLLLLATGCAEEEKYKEAPDPLLWPYEVDATGECRFDPEKGLVGACFHRCSSATHQSFLDCLVKDDFACAGDALQSDATTPLTLGEGADALVLNCDECVYQQNSSCARSVCPTEIAAADECFAANPNEPSKCEAVDLAANDCLFGNSDNAVKFARCDETRTPVCFEPHWQQVEKRGSKP